jgi:membrane-bound lytic murein transglycosylase MltF
MRPLSAILLAIILSVSAGVFEEIREQETTDYEQFLDVLPPSARSQTTDDFPKMQERGFIRVLVTFNYTDFFFTVGRPRGYQAELLREFQEFLNRKRIKGRPRTTVVYVPVPFNQLLPALIEGRGDIAAATLTITPERKKDVAFSEVSGRTVNEIVITRSGVKDLHRLEDLSGRKVYVLRGSSYTEHLKMLNRQFRKKRLKPIRIQEADQMLQTEDILEMVNAGMVDITVADDHKAELWAQVLPNLVVYPELKVHSEGQYGWAVRKNNSKLLELLNEFAKQIKPGTATGNTIFRRYYEDTRWVTNPVSEKEQKRALRLRSLFKKYGDRYGIDHLALAAQGYQESGLNQNTRSSQGAVGIMQLLPTTASQMGIKNIHIVENNIHAGAKYLAHLRDTYFNDPKISPDNQLALSWAAYNAGPARIEEMRKRAEKMGLAPSVWFGNVEYATLRHVGLEPVRYVAGVYKYYVAYRMVVNLAEQKSDTE